MTSHPKCEYDNDGTRITAPGKFGGERKRTIQIIEDSQGFVHCR